MRYGFSSADYIPPIHVVERDFVPEGKELNKFHYFVDGNNVEVEVAKKLIREALEYISSHHFSFGRHSGMLNDLGRLNIANHRQLDEFYERGVNYVGFRPGCGNMITGNRTPSGMPIHMMHWHAMAMCEVRKAVMHTYEVANDRGWSVTQYLHGARHTVCDTLQYLQRGERMVDDLQITSGKAFVLGTELEGTQIIFSDRSIRRQFVWFLPDVYLCAVQPLWVSSMDLMEALIDCFDGNSAMKWFAETFKEFGFGKQ